MPDLEHTWLVECFAPGIDDAAVAAAATRLREVVADRGDGVSYLGALLMAEDEVVFHAFRASDVQIVRDLSTAAGLEFERVVESVGVPAAGDLDRGLTQRLIGGEVGSLQPGATELQPRSSSLRDKELDVDPGAVTRQEGVIS